MADTGNASIDIDAAPEQILQVVTAIESYPDWMPAFQEAEILERDGEGRPSKARFQVDARLKVVNYTLQYSYEEKKISWEKTEGDVKEIKGSYTLAPQGSGTKVTYDYSIDPGFPVPGFLRRQGVKMMVSSALEDLKKRVESP